jgi:hypothetical protein
MLIRFLVTMTVWACAATAQNWIQLNPTGTLPPGASAPSVLYDSGRNRLVVFIGSTPGGFNTQVWVLTGANGLGVVPRWVQLSPSGTPPEPRSGQMAVLDSVSNRLILSGGRNGSSYLNEVGICLTQVAPTCSMRAWSKNIRGI